ncbi:hypothetical protein F441_05476 [Phytophthora nicotianae CJ01A1]|uniref:Uncharacterized protein n=1 Tax=Phytophthora nicotianae CJ01A1 TaxID=1317063 RepID=W2VP46_PHYNI|nr:hypothetical protein F441_22620 [Phytophthora nicotianae CJ01A1]ETP20900.1 hypothetical protein F441_05476 [Phytophthora nicotianae CJ01A1]
MLRRKERPRYFVQQGAKLRAKRRAHLWSNMAHYVA